MEVIKKISDYNLVATAECEGFEECQPPTYDGSRVYWYFKSSPELDKLILKYLSGEARVNPLSFTHFLRNVRRVAGELTRQGKGVK